MRRAAPLLLAVWLACPALAAVAAPDVTAEGEQPSTPAAALEVAPPEGWTASAEAPEGVFAGCRHYSRTDGLFALMVCAEDIDLAASMDEGYRRLGDALVRGSEEGLLLLAPRKQGKGAGLFVLLGQPGSVWRRQEAAPMLAAFADAFAVPGELLAPPVDPIRYLGAFSPEDQGREEELGCTVYVRSLPGSAEGKLLAGILPYSAAWLDKPGLLAALAAFWGELAPEGGHWTAGPKRHAALSADGQALCLLMAAAGDGTDTTEAVRQAMRDLSDFVW